MVMNTDILADWKNSRFVLADPALGNAEFTMVLTDLEFWIGNYDDLTNWCLAHGGDVHGMTVDFADEKTLSLFVLRWS
jgi:hypothetical protein